MSEKAPRGPRYRVRLRLDGQTLALKPFIHDLIGNTLMGMLTSLKAAEEFETVEIRIERRRPDERDEPGS